MTIGAALVVTLAGVLIALFLNATIGWIVAVIGIVGLLLAVLSGSRSRAARSEFHPLARLLAAGLISTVEQAQGGRMVADTAEVESDTEAFQVRAAVEDCRVTDVRRAFTSWLAARGASAGELVDWALITSELVANALAASPPGTTIDVDGSRRGERTVLRVRNHATETFLPRVPAAVAPHRLMGRGMLIADRLSDGLTFAVSEQVTVTCWKVNGIPDASRGPVGDNESGLRRDVL